jgi:hypothetical protein
MGFIEAKNVVRWWARCARAYIEAGGAMAGVGVTRVAFDRVVTAKEWSEASTYVRGSFPE